MLAGNDNAAILNYNEVASLFLEKKQTLEVNGGNAHPLSVNLGICYNNIACIHLRQKDFGKTSIYFTRAIQIAEEAAVTKEGTSPDALFKLVSRLYNKGYALYKQYLHSKKASSQLLCKYGKLYKIYLEFNIE